MQTVLETDEAADLDNYAKAILDGLKGPDGIMIVDTQVQALTISWIDSYGPPTFWQEARARWAATDPEPGRSWRRG